MEYYVPLDGGRDVSSEAARVVKRLTLYACVSSLLLGYDVVGKCSSELLFFNKSINMKCIIIDYDRILLFKNSFHDCHYYTGCNFKRTSSSKRSACF